MPIVSRSSGRDKDHSIHVQLSKDDLKRTWSTLMIDEAIMVDRTGATILELLLCNYKLQKSYDGPADIPDIIEATYWYLW